MSKKDKTTLKKVALIVGDLDDFESPAIKLIGFVRDDDSAQRVLVLAANDLGLDPITWKYV